MGDRSERRLSVCSKCMDSPLWQPTMGKTKEEDADPARLIIH